MTQPRQLRSITVIQRVIEPGKAGDATKGIRPVPPKIETIAASTKNVPILFTPTSPAEAADLIRIGAAVWAESDAVVRAREAKRQAEAEAAADAPKPEKKGGRPKKADKAEDTSEGGDGDDTSEGGDGNDLV